MNNVLCVCVLPLYEQQRCDQKPRCSIVFMSYVVSWAVSATLRSLFMYISRPNAVEITNHVYFTGKRRPIVVNTSAAFPSNVCELKRFQPAKVTIKLTQGHWYYVTYFRNLKEVVTWFSTHRHSTVINYACVITRLPRQSTHQMWTAIAPSFEDMTRGTNLKKTGHLTTPLSWVVAGYFSPFGYHFIHMYIINRPMCRILRLCGINYSRDLIAIDEWQLLRLSVISIRPTPRHVDRRKCCQLCSDNTNKAACRVLGRPGGWGRWWSLYRVDVRHHSSGTMSLVLLTSI